MNLRSFLFITLVGFALVFGASNASAQGVTVMRVEVPFEFVVGRRTLPAGKYDVRLKETSGSPYVTLRSTDSDKVGLALVGSVNAVSENSESGLTFIKYGETLFLLDLTVAGRNVNHQLLISKQLKAKQMAGRPVVVKPLRT